MYISIYLSIYLSIYIYICIHIQTPGTVDRANLGFPAAVQLEEYFAVPAERRDEGGYNLQCPLFWVWCSLLRIKGLGFRVMVEG